MQEKAQNFKSSWCYWRFLINFSIHKKLPVLCLNIRSLQWKQVILTRSTPTYLRCIADQTRLKCDQPTLYTVKNPPERYCDLSWFFIQALPWVPRIWLGVYFKINQNVHLFIFSTISELFNVYWYQQKVLKAARWEDKAIIKLSEFIWNIPRLFRHYHGMPWL